MSRYRKKPVVVEAVQWTGRNHAEVTELWGGVMIASPGDYIIKGVHGEFYPCKPDIFHKTYEEVSDEG